MWEGGSSTNIVVEFYTSAFCVKRVVFSPSECKPRKVPYQKLATRISPGRDQMYVVHKRLEVRELNQAEHKMVSPHSILKKLQIPSRIFLTNIVSIKVFKLLQPGGRRGRVRGRTGA